MQVEDWLSRNGLAKHAPLFAAHEIDLDILATLTDADLREMGLPLGARKRFQHAIVSDHPAIADVGAGATNGTAQGDAGERRQVTVVFCDLVNFTGLATEMDPEDLEALIAEVVEVCRKQVAHWGGHVGNYLGDGLLVYFGWPRAFEDAPQRAAHASLDMVRAVSRLRGPDGAPLAVRIGMATGVVLIGRKLQAGTGQLETVFGRTPNLAARLEGLAEPGEVLLDAATAALLPDTRFARSKLGERVVKGFVRPVGVWRLDRSETRERLRPAHTRRLADSPIVGRDKPFRRLAALWEEAQAGTACRIVCVSGEAGIGKSHLGAHLLRHCAETGGKVSELQCWPFNENATLYPVIAWLNDRANVRAGDSMVARRTAFSALAAQDGVDEAVYLQRLGDLLDLTAAPVQQTAEMRHAAWFSAIAEILRAQAANAPLLWLSEDIHWTDPVTAQLFEYLARKLDRCAMMIVATTRPHYRPDWLRAKGTRRIELARVSRDAAVRIVDTLVGDQPLNPSIRSRIIEASDGVPLFINELTREVLERTEDSGADAAALTIPATLQGVLSARLDSSQSAKPVAQVASCIGRVFDRNVLAQAMRRPDGEVQAQIDALVSLALIERLEGRPRRYIFHHALIQEAAHQSLTRTRRREIHGAIADVLAGVPGGDVRVLAHHLTAAERFKSAVERWKEAGDRAVSRSAQREAVELYRRALDLLKHLPEGASRDLRRLALLLALGPVVSAHDGYGADQVGAVYSEAAEIADRAGTGGDRFAVRRGLWLYRQMSAQYQSAEEVARELLTLAGETEQSEASALEANRALGATAFMLGKLKEARHHLEAGLNGYGVGVGAANTFMYGDDPGLACMAYLSSTHWYLGDPKAARRTCSEMLDLAREKDHAFSMARSLTFAAFTYHLIGDLDLLMPTAEQAALHAEKYEFLFHQGVGRILWGWGLCRSGDHARGWEMIEDGYARYSRSGSHMLQPHYLALMADIQYRLGDLEKALKLSRSAMKHIRASQEHLVLSEVLRMHGVLTAANGKLRLGMAHIDRAAETAKQQGAVYNLLHAQVAAARLDPRRLEALRTTLATFSTEQEGPDTVEARRVLEKAGAAKG